MFKKGKKVKFEISIDEKRGHLYLGEGGPRLLMLRPIDLIEFAEFAGVNAIETLNWCGKTLGKYIVEKLTPEEKWDSVDLSAKKKVILAVLEILEQLGYGSLSAVFSKDNIQIHVDEPLSMDEKENIMAKNICNIYQGVFNGLLEALKIDADAEEIKCILTGGDSCVFKYQLLVDEFKEEDIDKEGKPAKVADFLSSL